MGFSVDVTNAVYGRPAEGVRIRLFNMMDGSWLEIGQDRTDANGRAAILLDASKDRVVRLEFDLDAYFSTLGVKPAHPLITLTLRLTQKRSAPGVRLLVAPSAYVTYLEI